MNSGQERHEVGTYKSGNQLHRLHDQMQKECTTQVLLKQKTSEKVFVASVSFVLCVG